MVEPRQRLSPWIGRVLQDKWHIDAEIGRGGVASVFHATHRHGQVAAIKIIHAELAENEEVRKRFLREGYAANKVGHPGVVRVLDDDVEAGSPFIVMELLGEGELLEERRIRLGGRLPSEQVADVAIQMLDVLAAAHEQGIIHRDIKPENIFILADGTVKVLDFGIAHIKEAVTQHEPTATGLLLGTLDFMAPEQAQGKRGQIDAQTDIFAVGATLFALLSGESVHPDETMTALLVAAASRQPRSLGSVKYKGVPRAVIAVVDKALALEKRRRWASARAMQDALRAAVPTPARMRDAAPAHRGASSPIAPFAEPRAAPRQKLPMPAPPQRALRPSTAPAARPLKPASSALPTTRIEKPALPPAPPPSAPTARFPTRSIPPGPALPNLDDLVDFEDKRAQTRLPNRAITPSRDVLTKQPVDPWTVEHDSLDLDVPTVALKGAPAALTAATPGMAKLPRVPEPPRSSTSKRSERTTAKVDLISLAIVTVQSPPSTALSSPPPREPPPREPPPREPPPDPLADPSSIPPPPFAPESPLQPALSAPSVPSAPSAQPSRMAFVAIAVGAFVVLAVVFFLVLWLRVGS